MTKDRRKRFGIKVKRLRKERDLSQIEFTLRIGIDPDTLSRIEHGRANLTFTTLEKLADGFDMTLSELLEDI